MTTDKCPRGGKHAWPDTSYLNVCRSIQIPGVNPASHSRSGTCAKCGIHRHIRTAYPTGELILEDTRP